jgi:hypothetical protein
MDSQVPMAMAPWCLGVRFDDQSNFRNSGNQEVQETMVEPFLGGGKPWFAPQTTHDLQQDLLHKFLLLMGSMP